jgi:hypothetical protein
MHGGIACAARAAIAMKTQALLRASGIASHGRGLRTGLQTLCACSKWKANATSIEAPLRP